MVIENLAQEDGDLELSRIADFFVSPQGRWSPPSFVRLGTYPKKNYLVWLAELLVSPQGRWSPLSFVVKANELGLAKT